MDGRRKRRRSTSATIYIPIAALLIFFLTVYGSSAFLKILRIEVDGTSRYSRTEIINAAGIATGENIILVDTINAKQRIYRELPYISMVEITRSMPDTIIIEIKESQPLATVAVSGKTAVIDSDCKVLRVSDGAQPGLIEIKGLLITEAAVGSILKTGPDDETKLKYTGQILAAIESAGIQSDITYLDIANISNINFDYMQRRVLLGGPEDAGSKLGELSGRIAEIEALSPGDKAGVFNMSHRPWRWEPDR